MSLNNQLCTCCLRVDTGYLRDLFQTYCYCGNTENYGEMLRDCFGIHLYPAENAVNNGICEVCVDQLRRACVFKHQVLTRQKELERRIEINGIEVNPIKMDLATNAEEQYITHIEVKIEPPDDTAASELMEVHLEQPAGQAGRAGGSVLKALLEARQAGREDSVAEKSVPLPTQNDRPQPKKKRVVRQQSKDHERSRESQRKNLENKIKFQKNIQTLVENSNCTPFLNYSITGYSCAFCDETFSTIHNLNSHVKGNHKKDTLKEGAGKLNGLKMDVTNLTCNLCKTEVNTLKDLKKHLKEHNIEIIEDDGLVFEFKLINRNDFVCVVCQNNFQSYKSLLSHIMSEHNKKYECNICGAGFINRYRLSGHMSSHYIGEYPCRHCELTFKTSKSRMIHEVTHKGRQYKCTYCSEVFKKDMKRKIHMKLAHNAFPGDFICKVCNKNFLLQEQLSEHIKRTLHGVSNAPYSCTVCGKACPSKFGLKRHLVTHTGEKNYKCERCGRAYYRKDALVEHEKSHAKAYRKKCRCFVCGKHFVHIRATLRHVKTLHSEQEYEVAKKSLLSNDVSLEDSEPKSLNNKT